jgi:type I restriction enzyme S subunit
MADPVTERATQGDEDNILSLSAEHGIVLQSELFGKKVAGDNSERYLKIARNDFVYNDRTTKASTFGTIKRLSKHSGGIVSPIYKCFRFHADENPVFWEQYFESGNHDAALRGLVNEGARAGRFNISISQFLSTDAHRPDEAEQQKIAECLSSVDEVIAAQARKLDALKTHKKGLMQQLFPREGETQPRLRFPEFQNAGEWEVKRLGDIAEVAASGDLDAATFSPEPSEEHRFPIYSNAVEKEGIYGFSSVARYPANSVTITARGTLGRAFLRTTDFVGIGRLIVVSKFTGKAAPNFLKECWDHLAVIPHEVTSIPQLTAVAARATALPFPSLPEQHRIATCLSSLDALIAAETQKHAALQRHKRGLMQQLFPSPEKTS